MTGNVKIDATTAKLTMILASVMDKFERAPNMTPQLYGQLVHKQFADAVRAAQIPGIGYYDVETTFSLEEGARYGSPESIRTDVVLRDEDDKIIAIYDVKTGVSGLSPGRISELLTKTRAGPDTRIIVLRFGQAEVVKYVVAYPLQIRSR